LTWDKTRDYEVGVDHGVLYLDGGPGEVWNGLSSVKETDSGSDIQIRYLDGVKTLQRRRKGDFSGSVEAYTYPEMLDQRSLKSFGFSYRISTAKSSKIHLIYNARFSPGGASHKQSEVDLISWDFTTLAIPIPDVAMSAHLIVDADVAYPETVQALEDILYGTDSMSAHFPSPVEVLKIFEEHSILRVIDHGDGTFTITGPDEAIQMLSGTTWQITWPSAIYIDAVTYSISSL
jgi:hypothetical protein